jgi:molybdenum cofactor biosynthesis enzyme
MVNIGDKSATQRVAEAEARLRLPPCNAVAIAPGKARCSTLPFSLV